MPLFTGKSGVSPSILNRIGIFEGSGDDIMALGVGSGVKLAYCDTTSGGLLAEHYYFRKQDGTWQVLNLTKHDHAQDDDDSGGLYSKIRYNNRHLYYTIEYQGLFGNQVFQEVAATGGANVGVDFGGTSGGFTKLATGVTVGNYVNIKNGGRRHDWQQPSRFDIKCRVDSSTQIIARAGCNMESLIGSNDVSSKYGTEFCDSTGATWQIVSASGTVRSIQTTTLPGSTGTPQIYQIEHIPGGAGVGQVKLTAGLGSSPFFVKTSDPPASATGTQYSDSAKTVSAGIKTQDSNEKVFYIWGIWFEGITSSADVV